MAGIYIHIPYCKQACYYCDFHFSTNVNTKTELIDAIVKEIKLQKQFLENETVETIYFGGGTPSLLTIAELSTILDAIYSTFPIQDQIELTIECNPDDLNTNKLKALQSIGFNRLSIGIQSFDNKILKYFNRAHNAKMATDALLMAQDVGFDNISIDLIFGVPDQSLDQLQNDLDQAISLQPQHLSIYGLTIEEQTVFGKWEKQNRLTQLPEEAAGDQLSLIMSELDKSGFIQYEISNFCQSGFESKHNSSYWSGAKYLGLGPSAHSYDGYRRQFNVKNNIKYIKTLASNELPCEIEILSKTDHINEYILTQIRCIEGIDLRTLDQNYSYDLVRSSATQINEMKHHEMILIQDNRLMLTEKGKLLADFITEKLII